MVWKGNNAKLFFYLTGLLVMTHALNSQQYTLGLKNFTYIDDSRIWNNCPRVLEVTVWYPTNDASPAEHIYNETWKIKDVIKNATFPTNTKLPLIIFSHGFSGNQWQNSWFAENLAQNGYMVASVRHYGNSVPNMIPEICVRPWNRPQDMSFILDKILSNFEYVQHVDINRIGAAGFSQGGIACMWLAGVQANLTSKNIKEQITMMNDPFVREKFFKDVPSEKMDSLLDNFTSYDFEQANRSYYDNRFKAVFSMAPGIDDQNVMFTEQGLAQATTPTYIITGEFDEGTIEQTPFFAYNIPFCTCTILSGQVTHWTLLNEETAEGKLKNPFLTIDPPSINRDEIHAIVTKEALDFFNKHLLK